MKKLLVGLLLVGSCFGQFLDRNSFVAIPFRNNSGTPISVGNFILKDLGGNAITIQAPNTISSSYVLNMPAAQGAGCLDNDGSGNLSWNATCTGGGGGGVWSVDVNNNVTLTSSSYTVSVLPIYNQTPSSGITMATIKAGAGQTSANNLLEFDTNAGSKTFYVDWQGNLQSGTGTTSIGNGTTPFGNAFVTTIETQDLTVTSSGITYRLGINSGTGKLTFSNIIFQPLLDIGGTLQPITSYVNIVPNASNADDLGSTSLIWNNVYANNLIVSGTCTGCGAGSAVTYIATNTSTGITFQNASGNFEVNGNAVISAITINLNTSTGGIGVTTNTAANSIQTAGGYNANSGGTSANAAFNVHGVSVIDQSRNIFAANLTVSGTCTGCASGSAASFTATNAGASITFQNSNSKFLVDGNGNLTMSGVMISLAGINVTSGCSVYNCIQTQGGFNADSTGGSSAPLSINGSAVINSSGFFVGGGVSTGIIVATVGVSTATVVATSGYTSGGTAGVTCSSGINVSTFRSVLGIVTHC